MLRVFPALASIAGLLLIASLASAWSGPGDREVLLRWGAYLATLMVHAVTACSLGPGRRRVESRVARHGLPEWVNARAEKNRWVLAISGGLIANLLGVQALVPLHDRLELGWRLGLLALNLAFQFGAFAGEYLTIAVQARLVRELANLSDLASDP